MSNVDIAIEDVQSAFSAAKNLNAALKNFLKKGEIKPGDPAARFAKDFRAVVSKSRPEATKLYIQRHYPGNELYFMALARYAHSEAISAIVMKIFEAYAEDFNTTYEKTANGVVLKDKARFTKIGQDVVTMIDAGLKEAALPVTTFMRRSVVGCVFEEDVLKEVLALVKC